MGGVGSRRTSGLRAGVRRTLPRHMGWRGFDVLNDHFIFGVDGVAAR